MSAAVLFGAIAAIVLVGVVLTTSAMYVALYLHYRAQRRLSLALFNALLDAAGQMVKSAQDVRQNSPDTGTPASKVNIGFQGSIPPGVEYGGNK